MGIDQKITVCHLISGDLWAGAEVQAYTLLSALKDEPGINLLAVVLNEGRLAEQLRKGGIETIVIDESRHGIVQIFKILKEELKNRKIDVLHSHRYKENILAALLKKEGLTRYLVQTVHGLGEEFKGFQKIKIILYSLLNNYFTRRYFNKIIAVSNDIERQLKDKFKADCLTTVHNAVKTENIRPAHSNSEVRRELKIDDSQPVIGTAGRLVPIKGYDIFLSAAKIILEDTPRAVFLLAGDGPLKEELQQQALSLGIEKNVRFLGFREDIIDILNCLDIFVMSSHHEGIPMILLEAMALQKPVVSTAVGGVKEVIEDNLSGLLVKPGDEKSLALACLIVLNRPDTREKLSRGAIGRIEEEYSVEVQRARLLNLYRGMVN